jgi:hypothetical protein
MRKLRISADPQGPPIQDNQVFKSILFVRIISFSEKDQWLAARESPGIPSRKSSPSWLQAKPAAAWIVERSAC